MNEITLTKKDKLLKEGYKLIYPNNLDLIMTMKNKDNKSVIDKISMNTTGLSIFRFLKRNFHPVIKN